MAMRPIQGDAPVTFCEVEETLEDLQRKCPAKLALKLCGEKKAIGLTAATLQVMAAWANFTPSPELVFDSLPEDQNSGPKQNNLEILPLAGVCLASDIRVESISKPVRSRFYSSAVTTLDDLNSQLSRTEPLSSLFFLCADGTSRAFSDFFYSAPNILRPLRQFRMQISKAIHKMSFSENYIHSAVSLSDIDAISEIIYELFKNTDQWARTDIQGARLRHSVRGLFLNLVETKTALEMSKGNDALSDYLRRNVEKYSHFFEVSVFDSGPGYAQRFRGKALSEIGDLDNESSAVHGCLKLHSSSAEEAHRGVGLHCVLSRLDDFKAFLRIRTGRLALARSFDDDPYIEREQGMEQIYPNLFNPRLRDFALKNRGLTKYAATAGALITAVIPVGEPSP